MNQITLELPGLIAIKKNSRQIILPGHLLRLGNLSWSTAKHHLKSIPSKAYTKWEKQVREMARWQILASKARVPVTDQIQVTASIYFSGPQPDLQGALESVADALEGFIWENDRQIYSWDGSRLYRVKRGAERILVVAAWEGSNGTSDKDKRGLFPV